MSQNHQLVEKVKTVKEEIARVIVGQQEVVEQCLAAMLAGGHVLLEGVPGLGKTLLVTTLSRVFNISYNRIQFTPDLMPADITGTNLITPGSDRFEFKPGPVFANLVLADEINRATPKTQNATPGVHAGKTGDRIRPDLAAGAAVFVIATQNPLEMEGTYPCRRPAGPLPV